ncbi:MAG: hypothetical protein GX369_01800 [Euryarchaeota archaeon]|nr:hypothetical protein [Euryarchaeota archaeon]
MGLEDMLLEIKDTSELMVDLAYTSLLFDNQDIAEEVIQMHGRMDELGDEIEELAIKRAIVDSDSPKALAIIRMSKSVRDISYAALKIAQVVRSDLPLHPVIELSLRDSDVITTTAIIHSSSDLAGSTLGSVRLATNTGMYLIAIRRGRRYIYGPDRNTLVMEGDLLFARGPLDGEQYFQDLAAGIEHLEEKDLLRC